MDYLALAALIAVVAIGFYAALRLYTRRQLRHGSRPPDRD